MSKVKMFLQKWIVNNIGFKILALVFAFVLWLVITNTTDPVTTRTITGIPVQIENESMVLDGSRVYTIESGDTATVVVSGNRSIVSTLTASDFVATADFAALSITNAVPIEVDLVGDKARYAGSITITLKTHSMMINLENMDKETLDVEVQFVGQEPEDMVIEDAMANPVRVTFHAPESNITGEERAVAQIDYSEVTRDITLDKDLIIYDSSGNPITLGGDTYLDHPTVTVKITTSSIKSVPISIEASGQLPEGYELTGITYSKNNVSIRGDENVLSTINEIYLPHELLNIDGAEGDVTITVDVGQYLPEGVTLHGDTGTVTIVATITKKEEETTETETETTTEEETTTIEG
ncbi:MAG: hypothetical protein IKE48_00865 [Parasporobacterium sp.]|nr:hypothetical protein [Parasporobacterium sp.]